MGYDSTSFLPTHCVKNIREMLECSGYTRLSQSRYVLWEDNCQTVSNITASISKSGGDLEVHLHRSIWQTKFDVLAHNKTLRFLKSYIGGYFISDYGKNRYFPVPQYQLSKEEMAYCRAHSNLHLNYMRLRMYLQGYKLAEHWSSPNSKKGLEIVGMLSQHPELVSNHFCAVYLVSCLEDYFKSIFANFLDICKNEKMLKEVRLHYEDLLELVVHKHSAGYVLANTISFQNIRNIITQLNVINPELKLENEFDRPFGGKGISPRARLQNLIDLRHGFVHNNKMRDSYTRLELDRDIKLITQLAARIYKRFSLVYGWKTEEHAMAFGPDIS